MNLGNGKGPKHTGRWFQQHTPSRDRQPETSNSQIQPLDRNADHPPHQNPNLSGRFTHACSRNRQTAKPISTLLQIFLDKFPGPAM